MIRRLSPLVLFILALLVAGPVSQERRDPIRSLLAERVDGAKQGTGAVVGLLTPEGRTFAAYGRTRVDGLDTTADTIFEVGSITKVFTSFLLAQMVERGEVALDDPVRRYLPTSVNVPSRGGKEISLVDLATHTSGLPRDSVAVDMTSNASPYAGYTANALYAFLRDHRLQRDPGSQWEYSNLGMGLLGHVLALRAGMGYEDLLRRRIFEPLGMTNTAITFDAEQLSRRATGHNRRGGPIPPWSGGVIDPAGGVNSTAVDMLKFGAAVLDARSPLTGTFARMVSVRRRHEEARLQQGLGWDLFKLGANEILAKSGTTFGFQARFIVDTTRKRAVVVWINGAGAPVNDLIGLALDRARLP